MSELKDNNTLSCAVARDLMPLYVENLTEEETTEKMREHIASCAACAQSYGMQKTKLEIEKKPQRPDFRGIRFFKKSFLKRIALMMAVAIMGFVILLSGYVYVFENQHINMDDIHVVGQYELSDGRIVIALQADGHAVSNTERHEYEYADGRYYEYDEYGNRTVVKDSHLRMMAELSLTYDRFALWTKKADERGETFYYMFDPAESVRNEFGEHAAFSTPAPTDTAVLQTGEAEEEVKLQPYLSYLNVNGKRVWRNGDPLRKLTAEEEEVLLRTMEAAGFLDGGALLPQTDIIDTLMKK